MVSILSEICYNMMHHMHVCYNALMIGEHMHKPVNCDRYHMIKTKQKSYLTHMYKGQFLFP